MLHTWGQRNSLQNTAEGTNGLWKKLPYLLHSPLQNWKLQWFMEFRALDSSSLKEGHRDFNFKTLSHKINELKSMWVHKWTNEQLQAQRLKINIMHAINYLKENKPQKKKYINAWTNKTVVYLIHFNFILSNLELHQCTISPQQQLANLWAPVHIIHSYFINSSCSSLFNIHQMLASNFTHHHIIVTSKLLKKGIIPKLAYVRTTKRYFI